MDFDRTIDRSAYPTFKLQPSALLEHFGSADILPLWVADMDFAAPPVVVESLRQRAQHGIYGYEYRPEAYIDALLGWYAKRHRWEIDRAHLVTCPSVVSALAILLSQHTQEGDGVILQPPVFFEFKLAIREQGRRIVKNPLLLEGGRYRMDFAGLEARAADPATRVLILCNPHNPVGRVWTREELARAGEICRRHNVLVISDEVHGDMVYPPHRYTPLLSLSEEALSEEALLEEGAQTAIALLSPAKTFNIAGAVDALAVIPNAAYRERFRAFTARFWLNKTNVFASAAVEAAYRGGGPWLDELLDYLQANLAFLRAYLATHLPQVKLVEPEGTYLVWLDFRELGLDAPDLHRFLAEEARLALNAGYWFGREGAGFARMNIACPRSTLEEALSRLKRALSASEVAQGDAGCV